jgi:hypothetical protein
MTIWQRAKNLIYYDFCFCSYLFMVVGMIVWTSMGYTWLAQEKTCKLVPEYNNLMYVDQCANIAMTVFLSTGIFLVTFFLIIYSCDEGSCRCRDCCRIICLVATCCCCDIGTSRPPPNALAPQQQDREGLMPNENRQAWVASGRNLIGFFGLPQPERPPHRSDMVIHHHAPEMQGAPVIPQQNPYAPPPPPELAAQPPQDRKAIDIIGDKLTGWKNGVTDFFKKKPN